MSGQVGLIDWDDIEKKYYKPDEAAETKLCSGIMCEFIDARNYHGLHKDLVAEKSGLSRATVSRLERGETSPSLDSVLRVLAVFGKTLAIVPLEQQQPQQR